jgi:GDP/UDP-N,N'-diacetylbacillosamine 2-epimerase (hydrolysing)
MKVCIATTSRSDFGLLKNLIYELKKNYFKVKVIAGGSHYLRKFGNTFTEIRDSGISISKKIYSKTNSNSTKNIGYILSAHINSAVKIFKDLKPDLLIILGDRYEIFAITIAAHISKVPIAHIHGGEITSGVVDDALRHSITKMSQIHFAAKKIYRKRIIQLGESPKNVFSVGGLGVDSIIKMKLISRIDLEKILKIKFRRKNLLISFKSI